MNPRKAKALDEGNCGIARSCGEEAVVKAASPRTETCCEAADAGKLAPHSVARDSASEVKHGVVQLEFVLLPGEICLPGGPRVADSAAAGNGGGAQAEVSRGRSSAQAGARRPELVKGGETAPVSQAASPQGGAGLGRTGAAEKDPAQGELMERILAPENMREAWARVKANGGAAGVDAMATSEFPAFAREHWVVVREKLQQERYAPSPVRRAWIAKADGAQRPLGIPTVLDRVIQQAIAQVVGGLFEADFSAHSYAYRPGRNAHDALRAVRAAAVLGYTEAVDCDLKGFFDHVDHDLLMARVATRVRDPRVLRLIGRYLRADVVLPDGTREPTPRGVPQGGPLSPLLANIMLTPLDQVLEQRGLRFARYADDFIILVKTRREAERVMPAVIAYVEGKLKLVVNRTKSRVAPLAECVFLGCSVRGGIIRWSAKALTQFRSHVRELTSRTWGVSMEHRLRALGRYVTGWINYYRISRTYREVLELEQWLRRRVRQCYWKRWQRPRTRRRHLLRLGIDPRGVHLVTRSRKGSWRISSNSLVQAALSNRWLAEQGLPSLHSAWIAYHYPETARR